MPLDLNDPTLLRVIGISNEELGTLEVAAQKRLLKIYEQQRELLVARLSGLVSDDTFGARHLQVALKALDEAIATLNEEIYRVHLDVIRDATGMSYQAGMREVSNLEGAFGSRASSRQIASLAGVTPHRAILAVEQLARYETEGLTVVIDQRVKAILHQGLVQGLNSRQLVPHLARAAGEALDQQRWQLERTLRTGLNAAANRGHNAAYLKAREEVLDDLKRQGHEFIMTPAQKARKGRVNHPFSAYLDGKITELDQPWRVKSPAFEVMFWPREGDEYVGMYYPAHLYERGRQVPYRDEWNADRSSGAERAAKAREAREATEKRIADTKSMKKETPPGPAETQKPTRPATGAEARAMLEALERDTVAKVDAIKPQVQAIAKRLQGLDPEDRRYGETWQEIGKLTNQAEVLEKWLKQRLRKALHHPTPADVAIHASVRDAKRKAAWTEAADEFRRLVGPGLLDGKEVSIKRIPSGKANRAYYSYRDRAVYMDTSDAPRTIVHQLGHFFEHLGPDVRAQAVAFWERRTASDAFERLADLHPGWGFGPREYTKKDNFPQPYVGKVYYRSGGNKPIGPGDSVVATEVISMGLEELYNDPLGFARKDPDYFDFIWSVIRRGEA